MALNIGSQGGGFDPFVKFNGKSGRWYMAGKEKGEEIEVAPAAFVADFANIKTGWLHFVAGQAPTRAWDESLTKQAVKPIPEAKRGFSVRVFSPKSFGGIAELSSSSMHLCAAINDLYTVYEAQAAANPGKVPLVKFNGITPMKDKHGVNYKPNLVLDSWIARPAELDAAPAPQAAPQPQGAQAASQPAPAQPAPAVASVSEF